MRTATHRSDTTQTTSQIARDITRGVTEELHGPHPQTHRREDPTP